MGTFVELVWKCWELFGNFWGTVLEHSGNCFGFDDELFEIFWGTVSELFGDFSGTVSGLFGNWSENDRKLLGNVFDICSTLFSGPVLNL